MIEAVELAKVFYPPRAEPVHAVRSVSFEVGRGEVFGLLGPNGAGKTTLLRMLGTIIQPTSGYALVDGLRAAEDAHEVRRRIGFLSGNTRLYGRLTPVEVLSYFGRLYGLNRAEVRQRTAELVDLLDLKSFQNRRCETLSTGQLQRVSIARVLVHDPPVLILDEPTLGLDIMSSTTILDFISERSAQGCSVIFSTHYMTEAELLCDRVGLIHDGRVLAMGSVKQLYETTGTGNLKDAFVRTVGQAEMGAS